jgi:hypothetical protein
MKTTPKSAKNSKPAILYVEAQKKQTSFNKNAFECNLKSNLNLPNEIYLAYSIQYKPLALEIKNFLMTMSLIKIILLPINLSKNLNFLKK